MGVDLRITQNACVVKNEQNGRVSEKLNVAPKAGRLFSVPA